MDAAVFVNATQIFVWPLIVLAVGGFWPNVLTDIVCIRKPRLPGRFSYSACSIQRSYPRIIDAFVVLAVKCTPIGRIYIYIYIYIVDIALVERWVCDWHRQGRNSSPCEDKTEVWRPSADPFSSSGDQCPWGLIAPGHGAASIWSFFHRRGSPGLKQ